MVQFQFSVLVLSYILYYKLIYNQGVAISKSITTNNKQARSKPSSGKSYGKREDII